MLFQTPLLGEKELQVVREIDSLRASLQNLLQIHEPKRWEGSLRRVSMARAIRGSNTIEGFDAPLDAAAAIDLGQEPTDVEQETRQALKGYRDALTYVLQLARDDSFKYDEQLLKALHFMMTSYDMKNRPGQWRSGQIFVKDETTQEIVYEGAEVAHVPDLVSELVNDLNEPSGVPSLIRAGMAHLNLAMIHPFRDGNGRMARCLQTMVIARDGVIYPVFCSIEEYLGRNTQEYYDVLASVGAGHWQPERDTLPWIRFILMAHVRQARTMLRRVKEIQQLWSDLEAVALAKSLSFRVIPGLSDAAMGYRIRNATYRAIAYDMDGSDMTDGTATRDLNRMVEAGFLEARGERRQRFYVATGELLAVMQRIRAQRDPRDDSDPFAAAG